MGRKGRERQDRETEQVRYYQWEFLRRNTEYQREFDSFMSKFGRWFKAKGFWYERNKAYTDHDFIFYYNSICPVLQDICGKWHISQPLPHDWKFDFTRGRHYYSSREYVGLPTGYTSEAAAALWDGGDIEITGLSGDTSEAFRRPYRIKHKKQKLNTAKESAVEQSGSDQRYLTVRLDISHSKEDLLRDVVNALQFHRNQNRQFFAAIEKQKSRRRLDQYDHDLKVWDMRQSGSTFPEIAQQIYEREYRSHPSRKNPIVQRVTDHYRRADKLIRGGYKDLR
jgi:hypothetical protein